MRVAFASLFRLAVLTSAALCVVAVGLSRVTPRAVDGGGRAEAPARLAVLDGSVFDPPRVGSFFLDTGTGRLSRSDLAPGPDLDLLTVGPWRDAGGRFRAVGRLLVRPGDAASPGLSGFALAVFGMPGGRPEGLVEMDPVATGPPCWIDGPGPRVLYPSGDGSLYLQNLPGDPEVDGPSGETPSAALRVAWRVPDLGETLGLIRDPVSPPVPSLGGLVFVSLSRTRPAGGVAGTGSPEVWWLRLDADARAVVAAGRLTPEGDDEERMPNLVEGPGGRVSAAYLSRGPGESSWRLKVAPVAISPAGGPAVRGGAVRTLDGDCAVVRPAFSPDGLWVYRVPRGGAGGGEVGRVGLELPGAGAPEAR